MKVKIHQNTEVLNYHKNYLHICYNRSTMLFVFITSSRANFQRYLSETINDKTCKSILFSNHILFC